MANPFISESTGIRFLEVTIAVIFFLYKKFVELFSSLIIVLYSSSAITFDIENFQNRHVSLARTLVPYFQV